jgi:hypothetical protein
MVSNVPQYPNAAETPANAALARSNGIEPRTPRR